MSKILDRQLLVELGAIAYMQTWRHYEIKEEEERLIAYQILLRRLRSDNTIVVSAFPGVGKSYLFNNTSLKVLDSDSSTFDKSLFPGNYIQHIKENIGKVDIILVSSHEVVRKALVAEGIPFALVYPGEDCKESYIARYKQRGSPEAFIKLLDDNFENWVEDCREQGNCFSYELECGRYLTDLL